MISEDPTLANISPIATPATVINHRPVNCPPGLECLLSVNQLMIRQKVELLETITGFETNNQYDVLNPSNQKIFVASENTDCCTRNFCGPNRAFEMRLMDGSHREVIHLTRPMRCDCCCCFCCLQYIRVEAPPGHLIGNVVQEWSILKPVYRVEGPKGEAVFKIVGPICTTSILCQDVDFDVFAYSNSIPVGRISKQWSGLLREAFTDADFYGVIFPMDLDVRYKTILLAATFLIDYMFFEQGPKKKKDKPGMMDTRY